MILNYQVGSLLIPSIDSILALIDASKHVVLCHDVSDSVVIQLVLWYQFFYCHISHLKIVNQRNSKLRAKMRAYRPSLFSITQLRPHILLFRLFSCGHAYRHRILDVVLAVYNNYAFVWSFLFIICCLILFNLLGHP